MAPEGYGPAAIQTKDRTLPRKFLFIIAGLTFLVIAAALVFAIWSNQVMRAAFEPTSPFTPLTPRTTADYAGPRLWYARGAQGEVRLPQGTGGLTMKGEASRTAAVFFVHPTTYMDRQAWNAPADAGEADHVASLFVAASASAFEGPGRVWAPRYRQAAFGAFFAEPADQQRALDAAYGDVLTAFRVFLTANPDGPIILAGHSQGSAHLVRLIAQQVRGTPVAGRIAAAYVIGWPISVEADLPALGLPGCTDADQTGCVLSWQSFAPPADPRFVMEGFAAGTGLTGRTRRGTTMLCVNPLTGSADAPAAPASVNRGMIVAAGSEYVRLTPNGAGAQCDVAGILILDSAPDLGPMVLPGNNYHVYDYALFWANIRQDAARRIAAFRAR